MRLDNLEEFEIIIRKRAPDVSGLGKTLDFAVHGTHGYVGTDAQMLAALDGEAQKAINEGDAYEPAHGGDYGESVVATAALWQAVPESERRAEAGRRVFFHQEVTAYWHMVAMEKVT